MVLGKKAGGATLISNIIDFQPEIIKHDEEEHCIFIKVKNPLRGSLNSDHLCPKWKGTHIHKRIFTKSQNIHWTPHNDSGRLQHLTLTNGQVTETETKQRQNEMNRSCNANVFNRFLQYILPQHYNRTFSKIEHIIRH